MFLTLSGPLAGHYRLRTGDYRLQFRVEGKQIVIVVSERIGHRNGFYEGRPSFAPLQKAAQRLLTLAADQRHPTQGQQTQRGGLGNHVGVPVKIS